MILDMNFEFMHEQVQEPGFSLPKSHKRISFAFLKLSSHKCVGDFETEK